MKSLHVKYLLIFLCSTLMVTSTANLWNMEPFFPAAAMPSGTITGFGTYCQNEPNVQVIFTGSGGTGAGTYTFNYTVDGNPASISSTSGNTAFLPYDTSTIGASIYRIVSVSFNSGPLNTVSNAGVIFRTVAAPAADFSFVDDQCASAPITFTNNSSTGADITYLWDFGDGTTSTEVNPVHSFNAVGCGIRSFNVVLQVSRNGCTVTTSKVIRVKESPDLELEDVGNPFNPFNNCSGTASATNYEVTINNTSTSTCVSNISIDWGDGTVVTNPTFPLSHTYTTTGAFPLRILGDGDNGCSGEREYIVKNVSNPQGGLNSPGTTQNLCAPTPALQFAISNWGGNSQDTMYSIDYGDGSEPGIYSQADLEASASYNAADPINSSPFPVPHSYLETNCPEPSYTVRLNIDNACGSTEFTAANITVLSPPEADFTNPPSACVNTNVLFTNLSEAGFGINCNPEGSYTWDFGDGTPPVSNTTEAPEDSTHIYTAPGTYDVTLTAEGFCGSDSIVRTICIEPELVPAITYSNAEGCTDLDVAVTNTTDTTDFCNAVTYNWVVSYAPDFCSAGPSDFSFINGTDATSLAPEFNFVTPGRYTIGGTIIGSSCGVVPIPQQEVIVKQPPTVVINPIDDLCEGDALTLNPSAVVENCASSSTSLTYNWSFPGATPATATTADPGTIAYPSNGTYTISLSVTNECGTTIATDETFTISEDPVISGVLTECAGESQQLTATGTPSGSNSWNTSNTGIATIDETGLVTTISPGTVDITFTNDSGCTDTVVFEVTSGPSFTQQPIPNQEVCLGGTAQTLEVSYVDGNGNVTFQWYQNTTGNTSTGTPISGATSSTYDPDVSATGDQYYYVIVSFSEGCPMIVSDSAQVTVAPPPTVTTQPLPNQEVCVGATIAPFEVMYENGVGTPSYQWFTNSTNSTAGGTPITSATNSSYLPPAYSVAGDYFYYVEIDFSGSGCGTITSEPAEVIVVEDPTITQQPLATQEQCQGATATALEVIASGGLGDYSYQWYQNTVNSITGGAAITGATSDSYVPDTDVVGSFYYYAVISQAALDCEVVSETAEVVVVPSPTIADQPQSADYCEGDAILPLEVTLTNGTGTPTYQWYENTVASSTGGTAITGATSAIFNTPATLGTSYYYVEVSYSGGGCSLVVSDVATITIDRAPTIANESIIVCSGDLFTFTPSNAGANVFDPGTTYSWSLPVINPANSITGATASTTQEVAVEQQLTNTTSSAATAIYTVTPTSGTCVGAAFELEVQVLPKPEVSFSEADQLLCDGSTSTLVTLSSNFSSNITYEWTADIPTGVTGALASGTDVIPAQTLSNSTTAALTVTYFAKAIFLNGASTCEGEIKEYRITVQPSIIASGIVSDFNGSGVSSSGASDGFIDLTVSGGSGTYTFQWTGPNGYTASTEDISGLVAGNYQVSISDGICAPLLRDFLLTEPPEILLIEDDTAHEDLDCFGDMDGTLAIIISQGSVGPYDYELFNENGSTVALVTDTSDLRQEFTGLVAGTYSARITDGNGASKEITDLRILQPTQITLTASQTPISCYLENDATIRITASGGTGPYTASWNSLATGFFQENLSAGEYVITVTDANDCSEEITVRIEEPPVFFTEATFTNVSCFGANDGFIQLNLTGGIAPVNLTWNDGSTQGTTRNNLSPGTYTATITDGTSCSIVESFTIIEPQEISLDANITNALDCDTTNSGAINLLVSGGTAPFTYEWSTGAITEDITDVPAANYQVIVTDANDCTATASFEVTGNTPIIVTLDDRIDVDCETGRANQILTAQVSGGVAPYILNWSSGTSSGANNQTLITDQNGLVILIVTDAIGCERSVTFDVLLPEVGMPSFFGDSIGFSTYGDYSIQDPIQFTNTSTGEPTSISWDFGDGSFSNEVDPVHTYSTPGQYTVVQSVSYDNGCVSKYIITLEITKGYKLVMPNAFTPNGDKINDVFRPRQEGLEELKFSVYDSWGSLIYSEEGETIAGWDGTMNTRNTENGNFYFKLVGKTFYGEEIATEGTFTKID